MSMRSKSCYKLGMDKTMLAETIPCPMPPASMDVAY
jgi:hypothetical protein